MAARDLRWQVVEEPSQPALFDLPEREIGTGEFRGLEFLHVRARTIINKVGPRSPVPFRTRSTRIGDAAMPARTAAWVTHRS